MGISNGRRFEMFGIDRDRPIHGIVSVGTHDPLGDNQILLSFDEFENVSDVASVRVSIDWTEDREALSLPFLRENFVINFFISLDWLGRIETVEHLNGHR